MSDKLRLVNGGRSTALARKAAREHERRERQRRATKLRQDARRLAERLSEDYILLGEKLWEIYNTTGPPPARLPLFKEWGYPSFREYVEAELGIHVRRANKLKQVFHTLFIDLDGLSDALRRRIVRLGYTRAREIVRIISVDTAEKWVERAEEWTYWETYSAVRAGLLELEAQKKLQSESEEPESEFEADLGDGEQSPAELVYPDPPEVIEVEVAEPVQFAWYPGQRDIVEQAIERAGELSHSSIRSHNLYLICLEFLGTNPFTRAGLEQTIAWFAKLDQALMDSGVRIILTDRDCTEVVFGMETFIDVLGAMIEKEKP